MVSHDLTWSHLVSLGLTWSHLASHGLTWSHVVPHGLTWSHMVSLSLNVAIEFHFFFPKLPICALYIPHIRTYSLRIPDYGGGLFTERWCLASHPYRVIGKLWSLCCHSSVLHFSGKWEKQKQYNSTVGPRPDLRSQRRGRDSECACSLLETQVHFDQKIAHLGSTRSASRTQDQNARGPWTNILPGLFGPVLRQ